MMAYGRRRRSLRFRAEPAQPRRAWQRTCDTRGSHDRGDVDPVRSVSRRRACLVVPAAPAAKLAKGATLVADEVVLDLEDAVVPEAKEEARHAVVAALAGEWAAESVAV